MFRFQKLGTEYFWLAFLSLGLIVNASSLTAQDEKEEIDLPGLFQKAQASFAEQDYPAAAEIYQQYTKAKDDNGLAWFRLGYSLHVQGKLDEAIVAHKKATEFPTWKPTALFNLGCAYSLKNENKIALEYLHQSLDSGFNQFEMLDSDSDLENVRKHKGFKLIKERAENGGNRIKKKGGFDAKKLAGTWTLISGTRQGEEIAADRLPEITITDKDFTVPAGEEKFVMSYKVVDGSEEVIKLDIKIESGPVPEGSAKAILKMKGKKATLCYDPSGEKRPEKFETTKENGCFLFVMKKKAKDFDPSKVIGKWQVIEGTRAGESVAEDRFAETTITFDKNNITIPAGEDGEFVMSYEINPKTSPVQIDMKILSGPAPEGSAAVGIIKFADGKFMLCYDPMGADRPEAFESTEDNGFFMFTMKAEKK